MGSAARRAILLHQKILGKLTAPKSFRRGVEVVCNQVEQTAGNWADTKDGVSIWFPVFLGERFLLVLKRGAAG